MLLAARYKSLCVENEARDPLGVLLLRKISNPLGLRNGIAQLQVFTQKNPSETNCLAASTESTLFIKT